MGEAEDFATGPRDPSENERDPSVGRGLSSDHCG
jgi:hypothetical protein